MAFGGGGGDGVGFGGMGWERVPQASHSRGLSKLAMWAR